MPTYRIQIQPAAPTLTPWHAPTLFGHLCWTVYHEGGAEELEKFLAPYLATPPDPPFVISDGFPGDWLPRPLVSPPPSAGATKKQRVDAMDAYKDDKSVHRVTLADFNAICQGQRPRLETKKTTLATTVLKNQINRFTGTTSSPDETAAGNLYAVDELHIGSKEIGLPPVSIYLWAKDAASAEGALKWFELLARGGYGSKKSSGYGTIANVKKQEFDFAAPADANGFVALAHFVPERNDPREGLYETHVTYGKVGEDATLDGTPLTTPHKYPLVQILPGATFHTNGKPQPFYGRMVRKIHPDGRIVQYGLTPSVGIKL